MSNFAYRVQSLLGKLMNVILSLSTSSSVDGCPGCTNDLSQFFVSKTTLDAAAHHFRI